MPMVLEATDVHSSCWQKIHRHLLDRINQLRIENDSPKLSAEDTAFKRGRIAELVDLLDLGDLQSPVRNFVKFNPEK